ncbi:MAG: bifunctional homocysteine S-methyltransferase/methylenetetrahydrofolate reductase [Candidatus Aminicenantes bacterium]|nr:bifunctional homocysteine S-methyltransferase/methylenetetrahydrofolate reductase [Candidatus Aminicenantes bacterium]
MRKPFLEFCKNNIVLFDGAMGTEIYAKGYYINTCFDELNLSNPKLIKDIHRAYIEAGADVIETNTFGANRIKLQKHGLEKETSVINYQGAMIAREIAGEDIYVCGSIGPLGERLEPWGSLAEDEARDIYKEQAQALIEGGVDLLCLETFSDLHLIQQAILGIRDKFDIPLIAQMTIGDDGNSLFGTPPDILAVKMQKAGADIVGLNCSVGPKVMLDAAIKMVEAVNVPVSVMPNAGIPQNVDGRNIYLASAEYFGEYAKRFAQAGIQIIGSCCGTNPEFTRIMRKALHAVQPGIRVQRRITINKDHDIKESIPIEKRSYLAQKIRENRFVTSVEIVPPKGSIASRAVEQATILKAAGVDTINIPDGPRAMSRMSASYLSIIIQNQSNIEVIQHYTCRDRNLLGMVGDLLGAYASGIKNLLLITGDPPKMGTYPDATAVFDVDSIGLVNVVFSLNCGRDLGGNPLPSPTGFFTGVGVNPGAIDLDYEIRRFEWKVKAGAQFAITQPVFDIDILLNFLKRTEHLRIPLLAGIWPLVSIRNAEFMNNEIPGAHVPDEVMKKLRSTSSREEALKTGIEIARETAKELRPYVAGFQISMPFGNVDHVLEILKDIL